MDLFNKLLEETGDITLNLCDHIGSIVIGEKKLTATIAVTLPFLLPVTATPAITLSLSEYLTLNTPNLPPPPEGLYKTPYPNNTPVTPLKSPDRTVQKHYNKVARILHKQGHDEFWKEYLLITARAESVYGKFNKSFSGCKGVWQFCTATAKEYNLQNPYHIGKSALAAKRLAIDNKNRLIKAGISPTLENIYYAHMIGVTGLTVAKKAANGDKLTPSERRILVKTIGRNLSKPLLNRYFYNWKTQPKLKANITTTQVAKSYFALFEQRMLQYKADNAFYASQLT